MKRFKNILFVTQPNTDQESAFGEAVNLAEKNQEAFGY